MKVAPITSVEPSTAFMSALSNAPVRYEPMPGHANTISVSTEPSSR